MRVIFPVLLILLSIVLVFFLITNPGERVTVTLGNTPYPDVPLFVVVFVSLAVGVAFTAVVALIEGATIRLGNRRLRREIQRLETENSFLRTQPGVPPAPETEALEPREELPDESPAERLGRDLPGAPVYDTRSGDPATRGD